MIDLGGRGEGTAAFRPSGVVTLTTDFGLQDPFVGVMKGVMLGIAPSLRFVDLTHEVPPFDLRAGAYVLSFSWRCFPVGTVHLAVVDPGVGTDRPAVCMVAGGHAFVGPDNGLLATVAREAGPIRVHHLPPPAPDSSATFHGRDLFAPAAARLAAGLLPVEDLPAVAGLSVVAGHDSVEEQPGVWRGAVVWVDHFGNVVTSFRRDDLGEGLHRGAFRLVVGDATVTELVATFEDGPPERPFCYWGSGGNLEVAVRQGRAADHVRDVGEGGGAWPVVVLELSA